MNEEMDLRSVLASAKLYTDERSYCLVGLPVEALARIPQILEERPPPLWAVISDKDEISLLLPTDVWGAQAERITLGRFLPRVSTGYRLITFDVALPPKLVGFLAHVTRALAAEGIPILALSSSSRDHLLVPKEHFPLAWATLEKLLGPIVY